MEFCVFIFVINSIQKRSSPLISQDESDVNSSSFEIKDDDEVFGPFGKDVKTDVVVVETNAEIHAETSSDLFYDKPVEIIYNNRDILDLFTTMTDGKFNLQYAHLPDNNLQMFFANRSQYYRLGANGERQEFLVEKCSCCDFTYPLINNPNASPTKTANPMSESILKFLNSTETMMNLPSSMPITKRIQSNSNGKGGNSSINQTNNQLHYNSKATLNNINYMDSYKNTKINNFNNFGGNYNTPLNTNNVSPNAAIALYNMYTRGNSSFPSNPNNTLANNSRFNGSNSCDSFNNNNFNNMNGNQSSQATTFRPY